ncbi:MAG: KpsF/GutQ family sugar-phosphate isomerase [Hydrotalea sp.]|nr:KpsF/GutQ family sugar-phosphate isomerase [Hydrotalea sp.]
MTNVDGLKNVLNKGKDILRAEGQALLRLADELPDDFSAAVAAMVKAADGGGRVIVSGVGKSGHVGRKISSTLSSIGCPSFFIHPTEASHGDLGMMQRGDLLIAISNSGETPELFNILQFCKTHHITIVALTAKSASHLGQLADVVLPLGAEAEAGLLSLAPTTSTIKTMGLGDALAMGFLELKGFSEEQFRNLHPGGALGAYLGKKLSTAADVMHHGGDVPLVDDNLLMKEAILQMAQKRFGVIGVVDKARHLVGIITDGDLRRALDKNGDNGFMNLKVGAVMNQTPLVCRATSLLPAILAVMNDKQFQVMFVVAAQDSDHGKSGGQRPPVSPLEKNDKAVGIIHIHDILRV